jgi:hypothetical protein
VRSFKNLRTTTPPLSNLLACAPDAWHAALETLHMWMQIVGKVRMELTRRQITAGTWRCHGARPEHLNYPFGERVFEIEFDFLFGWGSHVALYNSARGGSCLVKTARA